MRQRFERVSAVVLYETTLIFVWNRAIIQSKHIFYISMQRKGNLWSEFYSIMICVTSVNRKSILGKIMLLFTSMKAGVFLGDENS